MSRSERQEQVELVALLRELHPGLVVHSVPNGGHRDKRVAARLKAEGVLAGVPDLFVARATPVHHGLYVELKRADGKGRLSPVQRRVIRRLRRAGYAVLVADQGARRALEDVEAYLRGEWVRPLDPGLADLLE